MKWYKSKLFAILVLVFFVMNISLVSADALDDFYSTLTVNNATSVQTQSAQIISFGGLATRSQSVTLQPFSFTPPSFSASCGNIDFYAGAFSYLSNASQLMAFLQNTLITAAPLIFINAMKAISPNLAGSIMSFFDSAQKLLSLASNSCELGTYLGNVGGDYAGEGLSKLTSTSFGSSSDAMGAITNNTMSGNSGSNISNNINSYANAMNTWSTTLNGVLNPNPSSFQFGNSDLGAIGAGISQKYGSIIWKGMQQLANVNCSTCANSQNFINLANLILSLTGDVIITPQPGDPMGIEAYQVTPTIKNVKNFYEGMPANTPIYACTQFNTTTPVECVTGGPNPNIPTSTISSGFKEMVMNVMNDLQNYFLNGTQLNNGDLMIIGLSPMPIYQLAQTMQDAGMTAEIASMLNQYSQYIAFSLSQTLLTDALRMAQSAAATKNVDGNSTAKADVEMLIATVQGLLNTLNADSLKYANVNPIQMVQEINYIRSYAMSQYTPGIIQKMQFAKNFNNY